MRVQSRPMPTREWPSRSLAIFGRNYNVPVPQAVNLSGQDTYGLPVQMTPTRLPDSHKLCAIGVLEPRRLPV
jgi:hypothetical protein